MAVTQSNVLVGTAQVYVATYGLATIGQPEPAPADPSAGTVLAGGRTTQGQTGFSVTSGLTSAMQGFGIVGTGLAPGTYIQQYLTPTTGILSLPAIASEQATPQPFTVANGISLGQAWGGNWVAVGATNEGVTFAVDAKTNDIDVEEQMTPVLVTIDSEDISVSFTSAEDIVANMQLAYGTGSVLTQAATGSIIGKTTYTLGKTLNQYSVGFEAVNSFGLFRRVYIPLVVSAASKVETVYRRAKAERMYAVTLRALCDPTQIVITEQTAQY
jgi:hypothetical protein